MEPFGRGAVAVLGIRRGLREAPRDIIPAAARPLHTSRRHHGKQQLRPASVTPFDYDTFFRREVSHRLHQGTYDFFLPLHHNAVGSVEPHQALAATDLYKTTEEIAPVLDRIMEETETPDLMLAKLKTIANTGLSPVTVFATTDYLGLSAHPLLRQAAKHFTELHGVSCTGSRYITGNSLYQQVLERECAHMHKLESSILFLSCFDANNCALSCLGSWLPDCIIYSDEQNHASIVEGIQRSGCEKRVFRHCDVDHLEQLMADDYISEEIGEFPPRPKLVVFESVYSMTGDVCPVREIVDVSKRYGALTFIDEAHSLGVYGQHGRGLLEEQACESDVDIVSSTLGKAVGVQGGYVASSMSLTEALRHKARGFVFTSTLTPAMAATTLVALRLLQTDHGQELRQHLFTNVDLVRHGLAREGIPVMDNDTHIVPVCVHDPEKVLALSRSLLNDYRMYVPAARSPATPRGRELLRIVPQPKHTKEQIQRLVAGLASLWKKYDLPYTR